MLSLEHDVPFYAHTSEPHAIVILGAGRYFNAPEYGMDTIAGHALERVRYGAYLKHKTGLPILTSGGTPDGGGLAEGLLMKAVLEKEFLVPVRWVESTSSNIADEARECWKLLVPLGIKK